MSAVSVVPPMQATQRPMAASSSVSNCISTGPLVVAIRTRNLPTVKDMHDDLQEWIEEWLSYTTGRDVSSLPTEIQTVYTTNVPVDVGSASMRKKPASASLLSFNTIITSPC